MKIQFGAACKDLFKTEKKWMTLLGLSVCILIPIVGYMVIIGFLLRRFTREREGHPAEDFDFNSFADYLKMGLWPTLSSMVFSLAIIPVALFFGVLPAILVPLLESAGEVVAATVSIFAFLIYILTIFLITVAAYPVMFRSGLMMDFKAGFSFRFIKSFLLKVGFSLVAYFLLLILLSIPLMLLGTLAFFVGAYVVSAWLPHTMIHLAYQHYDLHLEKGGERIPVNPELTKSLGTPPLPNASSDAS